MNRISFFLIFVLGWTSIFSQNESSQPKNNVLDNAFLITPTFTFQIPAADLAQRFGVNYNFGFEGTYKFGENWHIGGEGNFLFGNNVKETDHLSQLLTANGFLINSDGFLEEVNLSERGFMARVHAGKTFSWNPSKPNNGLLVKVGLGVVQHKILIDVNERLVRQLSDVYQTGYDRMSRGVVLSQFIGLLRLERDQFINLYGGLEFAQGFTKNRRPHDLGTNTVMDDLRLDLFIGVKLGWIIPVFTGQTTNDYYYY